MQIVEPRTFAQANTSRDWSSHARFANVSNRRMRIARSPDRLRPSQRTPDSQRDPQEGQRRRDHHGALHHGERRRASPRLGRASSRRLREGHVESADVKADLAAAKEAERDAADERRAKRWEISVSTGGSSVRSVRRADASAQETAVIEEFLHCPDWQFAAKVPMRVAGGSAPCYPLCITRCALNGMRKRTDRNRRSTLVFADPHLIFRKDRVIDGEQRWHAQSRIA